MGGPAPCRTRPTAPAPGARASGPAGPRGASCGRRRRRRAAGRKMMKFRFRRQGADPQREKLKQELFAFHKVRRRAGGGWPGAGTGPEPRRAGGGVARWARPPRSALPEPRASLAPSLLSAPLLLSPRLGLRRPLPAGLSASVCLRAALNSRSGSHSLVSLSLSRGPLGAPAQPLGPVCFAFAPRPVGRGAEWRQMLGGGAGKSLPGSSPPFPHRPGLRLALCPASPGAPAGDAWPFTELQFESRGLSFPCYGIGPLSSLLWALSQGQPTHRLSWSQGGGGGGGLLLPFFPG